MSEHIVEARLVVDHADLGDDDYHEMFNTGAKVRADKRGHGNPRMLSAEWQKWRCNNPDCYAFAFVSEQAIVALIPAVTS